MPWTAPRTWTAGEIVTAANMNTHVRDNMKAVGGTDKPAARANPTAIQSIPNATFTVITYGAERFDTQTIHSTTVNNSRMTIPTGWGGLWLLGTNNGWVVGVAAGVRASGLQINGTTLIAYDITAPASITAGETPIANISTLYALVAGDYVEVLVYQNTGGALNNLWTNNYTSEFWCIWESTG